MTGLSSGDKAPEIDLPTDGGGRFSLKTCRGKPVVVYFYPKDNTPGCTREAIDFTSRKADFDAIGTIVVGISPDGVKAHDKFKDKHDLAIVLASDENKSVVNAYGVWKEKTLYGRKYMGVDRSTFLIDGAGKIARAWRSVKVPNHVDEVLEAAKALTAK